MLQNHRIPESQHGRGWQGPLWVPQPNPLPKQGHPEQAAQDLMPVFAAQTFRAAQRKWGAGFCLAVRPRERGRAQRAGDGASPAAGRGSHEPGRREGGAGSWLAASFNRELQFPRPLTIFLIKTIKVFIPFVYCSISNLEKRFVIITHIFFHC